jgi:membrane protein required for colicin V production
MSFIDILLGGILAFGLIKGIRNGLFIELASLISFIIGIYLASKFSYLTRSFVSGFISWSPKAIQITAFLFTFILVIIAIRLLAKIFTKIADFAYLGWINRLAGGVFGVIRMVLLLGVFFNLVNKMSETLIEKETKEQSIFYNPVIKTSSLIFPVFEKTYEDLKQATT